MFHVKHPLTSLGEYVTPESWVLGELEFRLERRILNLSSPGTSANYSALFHVKHCYERIDAPECGDGIGILDCTMVIRY